MTTIKYPIEAANGDLVLSSNAVAEAIISAIQTSRGERVFRNRYGNDLQVFSTTADLDPMLTDLTEAIIISTAEYRPLSIQLSGVISDNGSVDIQVDYDDGVDLQTLFYRLI